MGKFFRFLFNLSDRIKRLLANLFPSVELKEGREDLFLNKPTDLQIETDIADVKVEPSKDEHLQILYQTFDGGPFLKVEQGEGWTKLIFKSRKNKVSLRAFKANVSLKVLVPDQFLNELSIATLTGDVYLRHLATKKIDIKSKAGDLFLENIKTGEMDLSVHTGDIDLKMVYMNQGNAKLFFGDLKVNEAFGNLKVDSMSGDLYVYASKFEHLKANSQSGDIQFRICQGSNLSLHSKSGDIFAEDMFYQEHHIRTVSGDIQMNRVSGERLDISTVSGDIAASMLDGGNIKMRTVSGDASIMIPSDLIPEEIITKTVSGDIVRESFSPNSSKMLGRKMDVQTISGDISVRSI